MTTVELKTAVDEACDIMATRVRELKGAVDVMYRGSLKGDCSEAAAREYMISEASALLAGVPEITRVLQVVVEVAND